MVKFLNIKKLEVSNKIKVTPPFLSCRFTVVQRAECLIPHCAKLDHLVGGEGNNKGLRMMVKQVETATRAAKVFE